MQQETTLSREFRVLTAQICLATAPCFAYAEFALKTAAPPFMDDERFRALLPTIKRIAAFVSRRHRLSSADAEDFQSSVMVKLIAHEYAALRAFRNQSSFETFLTVVITRAFQDFRNSQWGKWRPSAAARRLGPVAVLLEQYVTRDGFPFGEAVHALRTRHGVTLSEVELEQIAAQLPVRFKRRAEPEEALAQVPGVYKADELVVEAERARSWERILAILREAQARLPEQDALVFALRFSDGRQVSEIARILGLEQRPLYERINRMKKDLRAALEAAGVDDAVRSLLHDSDHGA
jgi:RNA polymerase sigma factor (sigma-70 family)